MSPNPTETKEQFDAKAKAEGWKCSRCGNAITWAAWRATGRSDRGGAGPAVSGQKCTGASGAIPGFELPDAQIRTSNAS